MDTLSYISLMTRVASDISVMDDGVQARIGALAGRKRVRVEELRETLRELSWSLSTQSLMATSALSHAVAQEERLQAIEERLREKG
jgi:hypothetical protein